MEGAQNRTGAAPSEWEFPLFRRTSDGRHFYCIESDDRFQEVQIIGRRRVLHRVHATMYPELIRIREMIDGGGGRYLPATAAEWQVQAGGAMP
jgi:hypothetical protein